jgi:hypothetical protein
LITAKAIDIGNSFGSNLVLTIQSNALILFYLYNFSRNWLGRMSRLNNLHFLFFVLKKLINFPNDCFTFLSNLHTT